MTFVTSRGLISLICCSTIDRKRSSPQIVILPANVMRSCDVLGALNEALCESLNYGLSSPSVTVFNLFPDIETADIIGRMKKYIIMLFIFQCVKNWSPSCIQSLAHFYICHIWDPYIKQSGVSQSHGYVCCLEYSHDRNSHTLAANSLLLLKGQWILILKRTF